ncbi:MAG TPA: methyltransferase domain-containing protein [Terriglobia bacterium]|nr:methyltransferase domain-containing protein [Terriglobia bacterium]
MSLRLFAAEGLRDFATTAAFSPSSGHLASAMLEPLPLAEARIAVEFGAGTGAITRALLSELPTHAKLLVFEINPRFIEYLKENFPDPRLVLINSSVENLDSELRQRGYNRVDAVASSLGLGLMSDRQHHVLFKRLLPFLHEKTVLTQYQYIQCLQFTNGKLRRLDLPRLLGRYFGSVQSKIVWRNLPPAFVFTCHVGSRRSKNSLRQPARQRKRPAGRAKR